MSALDGNSHTFKISIKGDLRNISKERERKRERERVLLLISFQLVLLLQTFPTPLSSVHQIQITDKHPSSPKLLLINNQISLKKKYQTI